jgi:hypothetical protein
MRLGSLRGKALPEDVRVKRPEPLDACGLIARRLGLRRGPLRPRAARHLRRAPGPRPGPGRLRRRLRQPRPALPLRAIDGQHAPDPRHAAGAARGNRLNGNGLTRSQRS